MAHYAKPRRIGYCFISAAHELDDSREKRQAEPRQGNCRKKSEILPFRVNAPMSVTGIQNAAAEVVVKLREGLSPGAGAS